MLVHLLQIEFLSTIVLTSSIDVVFILSIKSEDAQTVKRFNIYNLILTIRSASYHTSHPDIMSSSYHTLLEKRLLHPGMRYLQAIIHILSACGV